MARYSARDSDEVNRTGWYYGDVPNARLHMCFPPRAYPSEVGPGDATLWKCPVAYCGIVWRPEGIQIVGDDLAGYPVGAGRNDVTMGPERWLFQDYTGYIHISGPTGVTPGPEQEGHYDWRPLAPYYVRLWRAQLEAMGIDWKALS